MADMITNVQSVADQVTNGAEQVAAGSMDLAEGQLRQGRCYRRAYGND